MIRVHRLWERYLAEHTGKKESVIDRDTERDNFMSAEESLEYGIIDQVLSARADPDEKEATE